MTCLKINNNKVKYKQHLLFYTPVVIRFLSQKTGVLKNLSLLKNSNINLSDVFSSGLFECLGIIDKI